VWDPKASSSVSIGATMVVSSSLQNSKIVFDSGLGLNPYPLIKMLVPPAKEAQEIP
jgi:hypothetical protein